MNQTVGVTFNLWTHTLNPDFLVNAPISVNLAQSFYSLFCLELDQELFDLSQNHVTNDNTSADMWVASKAHSYWNQPSPSSPPSPSSSPSPPPSPSSSPHHHHKHHCHHCHHHLLSLIITIIIITHPQASLSQVPTSASLPPSLKLSTSLFKVKACHHLVILFLLAWRLPKMSDHQEKKA